MSRKQQNGPRVLETILKNKKDGGCVGGEFVLAQFPRHFLEIFFALSTPHGFRSNSKENKQTNKQTSCYRIAWFKRLAVLKADERCHDFRWYRSQFLQTLVLIFPWKSTQVKIHSKMASVCLVFSAKNPVKSDKLALIEGEVLNEMFLDVDIPVLPIDNWLGVTHNQRQKKTLKVASVLLSLTTNKAITTRTNLTTST